MRTVLPFVLFLAAVLVFPPFSAQGGTAGPETADLLFTSNRDGKAEIFLLRAGDTEWRNLSRHEASDNWPVWSPDGSRIVFQSNRAGNLDVFTMKADGSEQMQLTRDPEPDYLPSWSPDGESIVFTSWRIEAGEKRAPHIYVMKDDGTEQRRLVAASPDTSADAHWSPDGKSLVFSRKAGTDGANLFVAEADGKTERKLTDEPGAFHGSPVFSPDGKSIAFYADDGKASALVVVAADGTGRKTIRSEGQNWYPRWSPDGRWLLYTAPATAGNEDNLDLFAISTAGDGKPILLVGGAHREQEGSWRPKPSS